MIDASSVPGLPSFAATKGGGLRCYPALRLPSAVRLLVLHQWGAHADLRPLRGETLEACAVRRARSTPYHLSVFARGPVVWAWSPTISSWASNRFNRASIAIGVGGRFPGVEAERLPTHSRTEDFEKQLVEALAAVARRLPGLTVVTHRQASRARRADPGEAIAAIAAREAPALGLVVDFERVVGSGAPCPASWSAPRGRQYFGPLAVNG